MKKVKRLLDEYRYPGFEPQAILQGIFGDPQARVTTLKRRQKKQNAAVAGELAKAIMTKKCDW